ncbi:MAG: hypothetical protein E7589_00585 [Ruminococcaceae bacterium]|nr:hypothetical protein [Oscillospiraceae bacterium]
MLEILYRDKYLCLCRKPVGIPSQPDRTGGISLLDSLTEELGFAGLVHRLDTPTGGVIMYSLSEQITGKLSALVSDHEAYVKEYLAVSEGIPEGYDGGEMIMEDLLYHDKLKNKTFAVDRRRAGVKPARLVCRLVAEASEKGAQKKKALWSIRLYTGRTHQIRAQFATRRAPLSGDGKYGGRENRGGLALWSYSASFTHPITGKPISVCALPDVSAYPWSLFYDSLSEL